MKSPFKNRNMMHASLAAFAGLRILYAEKAARRESAVLAIAVATFIYGRDFYSFLLILIALIMMSFEANNTAIEVLADEVNETFRPRIKAAKDLGAAAVLILVLSFGLTYAIFLSSQFADFISKIFAGMKSFHFRTVHIF